METCPSAQRVNADHQSPVHTCFMLSHFLTHSLHTRGSFQRLIKLQPRMSLGCGRNRSTRRKTHAITARMCKLLMDSTWGQDPTGSLTLWGRAQPAAPLCRHSHAVSIGSQDWTSVAGVVRQRYYSSCHCPILDFVQFGVHVKSVQK